MFIRRAVVLFLAFAAAGSVTGEEKPKRAEVVRYAELLRPIGEDAYELAQLLASGKPRHLERAKAILGRQAITVETRDVIERLALDPSPGIRVVAAAAAFYFAQLEWKKEWVFRTGRFLSPFLWSERQRPDERKEHPPAALLEDKDPWVAAEAARLLTRSRLYGSWRFVAQRSLLDKRAFTFPGTPLKKHVVSEVAASALYREYRMNKQPWETRAPASEKVADVLKFCKSYNPTRPPEKGTGALICDRVLRLKKGKGVSAISPAPPGKEPEYTLLVTLKGYRTYFDANGDWATSFSIEIKNLPRTKTFNIRNPGLLALQAGGSAASGLYHARYLIDPMPSRDGSVRVRLTLRSWPH